MSEDENRKSVHAAIKAARAKGIEDPLIECEEHGTSIRLSQMSPIALMALEAGLDAEETCLLLAK